MVSIQRSHSVTPSEATPSSTLSLSLCDNIKIPTHELQLFLYTNTSITHHSSFTSAIHTLSTSLSKTFNLFYPVAGRLKRTHGGRFQLLCNAKGAILIEASCDRQLSFQYLCDFAPTHAVPVIDYHVPIEDVPLLVVQVTRFSCGFVTVAVAISRSILDGNSLTHFLNTWAMFARGEELDSNLIPLLDRSVLDSLRFNKPPRFEHPEFLPPPLGAQTSTQMKKVLATAILRVTKEQVQKLKKKANDFGSGYGENGNNGPTSKRGYTSFEVISGHLWKCVCKVRYACGVSQDQPTRLTTLVDCRNRFVPSLPTVYSGNAAFPTATEICSFGEIMYRPLGYAVGKVREAIGKMSNEYVRDALDYIATLEDMDSYRDMFYNSGSKGNNPNLYVITWTNFKNFETDFGWGKPVCLIPGNVNSDGKAFVLDTNSGDAFLVAVCLQASLLDALKKVFYQDIGSPTSKL